IQSGPMLGYSEMREVMVWVQLNKEIPVRLVYWPSGSVANKKKSGYQMASSSESFVVKFIADHLQPGTRYEYALEIKGKQLKSEIMQELQTQTLWQWRTDPPALSFVAGSCFNVNEEPYDRPGKPYGGSFAILGSMHAKKPDFMVWL